MWVTFGLVLLPYKMLPAVLPFGGARMAERKQPSKGHFIYEKAEGYRLVHATGARGAVTPGGDIMFELFSEAASCRSHCEQ